MPRTVPRRPQPDPVSQTMVAELLEISRTLVNRLWHMKAMPEATWMIGKNNPVWHRPLIVAWAIETGRMERPKYWHTPKVRAEDLPQIYGTAEVAALFGYQAPWTQLQVRQGTFPPPRWRLPGPGMLWLLEDFEHLVGSSER